MANKEDVIRKVNAAWPNMTGGEKDWIINVTGKGFTPIEGALDETNIDNVNSTIDFIVQRKNK